MPAPLTVVDEISGAEFLSVQAAAAVLVDRAVSWNNFRVHAAEKAQLVIFERLESAIRPGHARVYAVRLPATELQEAAAIDLLQGPTKVPVERSIRGESVAFISAAVRELSRRSLDPTKYRIRLIQDAGRHIVAFSDVNVPAGSRAAPAIPGFEAEISPTDYSVIRANFVR